ncbi:MAG TPA: DNA repair protein RecO [Bacteroidales bacterium]|jgi:DNA repair protein RecO (recombination protein O)|nr:DNA repair protein RecO [Bacteroidales bacterium]HOS73098.1 DNA repair protein RecO [Bacteroidales bacterium]HQH24406.1 DNA repair protein RecO [Bacteroidales bacterium]HQJ81461.1 DNA repair protein RecO [Bacteroidales bacterium]
MIESTKAIVLHQIRYSDSAAIIRFFTSKFGRMSCMVRGMGNRKAGRNKVLFQPMSILDLSLNYRESREIQTIRDFSPSYSPSDIWSDIRKCTVAIFLGEVLTSVLREESPNEPLFRFIEDSVVYFDKSREGNANFHLAFMAQLTGFLGFEPSGDRHSRSIFFDMLNGTFTDRPPGHRHFANPEISAALSALFSTSPEEADKIALKGSLRNEILDTLMNYFSLHLPGIKKINSLEVLRQVYI